jgi:hypothetical protein
MPLDASPISHLAATCPEVYILYNLKGEGAMFFASSLSSVVREANSVAGFGLDPEFAQTLSELLAKCRAAGLDFRLSQGLRTPQKQAEYYCKWAQRSPADIDTAARKMERDGAPWLASVLRSYRNIPRQTQWLTSALPGAGWHQWGLAADCYCYRNGHLVENGSDPVYKFYAEQAVRLGLTAGYYFTHQDAGHVQGPSAGGATDVYTWSYIDGVMKERFADKERVALSSARAGAPAATRIETMALSPASAQFGMRAFAAAAAAGPYYKDDPILVGTRLEPEFVYTVPSGNSTLKRMARTFNAIGGLVNTLAQRLGIDPVAVLAVWYVESGGRAFTPGKPVLRFENHIFFDKWGHQNEPLFDKHFQFGGHAGIGGRRSQNHKYRQSANQPWAPVHIDNQDREYEVFALGERLGGREAASLSSSFGGPQIMGFNFDVCGYPSAVAMAEAFGADQRWQVLGFFDFCRSKNLIDEIQSKRWNDFGRIYNGDGATYGPLLKAAFDTRQALLALPKTPNPQAERLTIVAVAPAPGRRASAKPKRGKAKAKSSRARLKSARPKPKASRAKLKGNRGKSKSSRGKVA